MTRFALPNTGAAAVSPAFAAEWEFTTGADRIALSRPRIGSTMTSKAVTDSTATANRDALARQYVSEPIPAQTITGTLKGQLRVFEGATTSNLAAQVIARVVSNDGSTVRGTLYAGNLATGTTNPTSEFGTSLANRQFPTGTGGVTLTSVTALANDRIVIEIGYRKHSANSTTGTFSFGDDSATELPEDETTTTASTPWIEFSQDLIAPSWPTYTTGSYADTITKTTGLAAYWRLGESAGASTAAEEGGRYAGANTSVTAGGTGLLTGDTNTAYTFNGTTSSIDAGHDLKFPGTQNFSIEFWVQPTAPLQTTFPGLVANSDAVRNGWVTYVNSSGTAGFDRNLGGTFNQLQSASVLSTAAPTHIVATYDGTTMRLYQNAGTPTSTPSSLALVSSTTDLTIGSWAVSSAFFHGVIDEVAIYTVALSAATISAHYTAGTTAPSTPIAASDSPTVGDTETAMIGQSAADSPTVATTETATISAALPVADGPTVTGTDVATVGLSVADAPTVGSADVATLGLTASDTPTVGDAETASVAATIPISDSPTVGDTETTAVAATVPVADSPTVASAEGLTLGLPVTDSGPITGTETLSIALAVSDSPTIGASEISAIAATVAASDSGAVTGTDTATVAAAVSVNDSGPVGVAEALTTSASVSGSDSVTVVGAESADVAATVPVADSGTVGATETVTVDAGGTPIAATEAGTVGAAETVSVAATVPVADAAVVGAAENVTVLVTIDLTDTGTVTVTESTSALSVRPADWLGTVTVTPIIDVQATATALADPVASLLPITDGPVATLIVLPDPSATVAAVSDGPAASVTTPTDAPAAAVAVVSAPTATITETSGPAAAVTLVSAPGATVTLLSDGPAGAALLDATVRATAVAVSDGPAAHITTISDGPAATVLSLEG